MDDFFANCHAWGEGVAAGAGHFFEHDAPAFFNEAGQHLDRAGQESARGFEGAMSEAGKGFEGTLRSTEDFFVRDIPDFFAQHADAAAALLANADAFFKDPELAQWIRDALEQLARGVSASLCEMHVAARRMQRFFEHCARRVGDAVLTVQWDQIPRKIRTWVEQHPWQTAFYVACGVVFVVPALVYGPALGMMGFSTAGPVAGSLAAGIQSTFSPAVAGGVFATLQSAAMGGYGVGPVAALTQVGAVAAMTAVGLSDHAVDGSEKDDDEKED